MSVAELEKRLTAVEQELARLKALRTPRHPIEALEQIHGTFEDDEAFRQATRLGRKWRKTQRPTPRKKASRK